MLGPLLLLALPAAAPAPARPEPMICVTVAHMWWGGNADIRAIAVKPVPESFAHLLRAGGCTAWSLVKERLIEWHLAFGNEGTTSAALRFFEDRYAAPGMRPEALPAALAAARRRAEPAIAAAAPGLAGGREASNRAAEALAVDAGADALRSLNATRDAYLFLAQQYGRAAAFYESRPLYEKAVRYFAAVRETYQVEPTGPSDGRAMAESIVGIASYHAREIADLDMRLAVLRARLTRSAADLEAAQEVVERRGDAAIRAYGARAAGDPGEPCRGDIRGDEALAAACADADGLRRRAGPWWRSRAELDLLLLVERVRQDGDSILKSRTAWQAQEALATAILLSRDPGGDQPLPSHALPPAIPDAEVELLLARADMHLRIAALRAAPAFDSGMVGGDYAEALADLGRAAMLAPPARHPARFRQAAERYLALYDRLTRDPQARASLDHEPARQAALFRLVLPQLGRIAAGEAPPRR